jgi:hypothetical protein
MLQRRIALILAVLLLTNLTPNSFAGQDIATDIQSMPAGTNVEVRLKTREREKLRGTTGAASASSFTLTDTSAVYHRLAFDDIASVKRINGKPSHTTRNVLIVAGVRVVLNPPTKHPIHPKSSMSTHHCLPSHLEAATSET